MTVSKINPTEHSTCGIFLINMMSEDVPHGELLKHFRIEQTYNEPTLVDVTMQINGVPVDFKKSLEEMWSRLFLTYENDVLEKAKTLVSRSKFDKLNDILEQAEYSIMDELRNLQIIDKEIFDSIDK